MNVTDEGLVRILEALIAAMHLEGLNEKHVLAVAMTLGSAAARMLGVPRAAFLGMAEIAIDFTPPEKVWS